MEDYRQRGRLRSRLRKRLSSSSRSNTSSSSSLIMISIPPVLRKRKTKLLWALMTMIILIMMYTAIPLVAFVDAAAASTGPFVATRRVAFVRVPRQHYSYPSESLFSSIQSITAVLRGGGDDDDDDDGDSDDGDDDLPNDIGEIMDAAEIMKGRGSVVEPEETEIEDDDQEKEYKHDDQDNKLSVNGISSKDSLDASLSASVAKKASKTKKPTIIVTSKQMRKKEEKVAGETKKSPLLPKKKKQRPSRRLRIPYILQAFLNPFTVLRMTRAYWASLVNLDFLQQNQQQQQQSSSSAGIEGNNKNSKMLLRNAMQEKAKYAGSSGSNTGKKKGPRKTMKRGQAKTLSDLPQLST